eukprot:gene4225-5289_t
MEDLDSKIIALKEAFPHSREIIIKVLEKNNYSMDDAAMELAGLPFQPQPSPPQQQQQQHYQPYQPQPPQHYQPYQPQVPPPQQHYQPYQPQVPPPQQQPPVVPPQQQQQQQQPVNNNRQEVYKQLSTMVGDLSDMNQSMIFDVYHQNNKNIKQTADTLKEMQVDLGQIKIQETIKQENVNRMNKELELKRKQEAELEERLLKEKLERELIEKERMDRANLEKKRMEHALEQTKLQKLKKEEQERLDKEKERLDKEKERLEKEKEDRARLQEETQKQLEKIKLLEQTEAQLKKKREEEARRKEEENKKREKEEEARREAIQKEETEKIRKDYENKMAQEKQLREMQRKKEEEERAREIEKFSKEFEEKLSTETEKLKRVELEQKQLIDSQKKEIEERILQIDLLKQKEFEYQKNNASFAVKAQNEIQGLKQRLTETEQRLLSREEQRIREENEVQLKHQIQQLETQKELQRLQIQELEQIQKNKLVELESQLLEKQKELQESKKLSMIQLGIELDPTEKDHIHVDWNLGSKYDPTVYYWVGIYPTHQPKNDRYHVFKRVEGMQGTVSFPSIIPGHYEARIFKDKYTLLQTSSSVQVGPDVVLNVHVIGDEIHVSFTVDSKDHVNTKDWIGLYTTGLRNKKYTDSQYVNSTGTLTFKSPRTPGIYEVRYFLYPTKYNEQSKLSFEIVDNDTVRVDNPIVSVGESGGVAVHYTVNTVPPSTYDWIGLFAVGEEYNKNYIESKYTNGTSDGTINFSIPEKPGEYEFRFFSYSKGRYITFKVSNVLVVSSQ